MLKRDDKLEDSVAAAAHEEWSKVIRPMRGWTEIRLTELWRYRDLVMLFVRREFVVFYKQTVLGPLWFLLQPFLATLMFTVIFGKIAGIPTDGSPQVLFYMGGIVVWNYFSDCLTKTSDIFVSNAGIFGKVYFPRLVLPIAAIVANLMTFATQFLLFVAFLIYFYIAGADVRPGLYILLTPLLLVQMAVLGLGLGVFISSLTVKYRDLRYVMGFGLQLWMYATPVVYPMSLIPRKWQWVFALNPMSAVVETSRYLFIGTGEIRPVNIGLSLVATVTVFIAGLMLFSRVEKTSMDAV